MDFFDNVFDAITQNKPLVVSAETALKTIQIILTALESSKQQRVLTL